MDSHIKRKLKLVEGGITKCNGFEFNISKPLLTIRCSLVHFIGNRPSAVPSEIYVTASEEPLECSCQ